MAKRKGNRVGSRGDRSLTLPPSLVWSLPPPDPLRPRQLPLLPNRVPLKQGHPLDILCLLSRTIISLLSKETFVLSSSFIASRSNCFLRYDADLPPRLCFVQRPTTTSITRSLTTTLNNISLTTHSSNNNNLFELPSRRRLERTINRAFSSQSQSSSPSLSPLLYSSLSISRTNQTLSLSL